MDEYTVFVTYENSKTNEYKIKIKSPKKSNIDFNIRKFFFLYFSWFTIFILMGVAFFTRSCLPKEEVNEKNAIEIKIDNTELKNETVEKNKFENNISFICLTLFCTSGLIFLIIFMIKDDSVIRLSKLKALTGFGDHLRADLNSDNLSKMSIIDEKEQMKKSLYSELAKTLISSISEV